MQQAELAKSLITLSEKESSSLTTYLQHLS